MVKSDRLIALQDSIHDEIRELRLMLSESKRTLEVFQARLEEYNTIGTETDDCLEKRVADYREKLHVARQVAKERAIETESQIEVMREDIEKAQKVYNSISK